VERDPDYALACRQMHGFGGMISFELKGGYAAGEAMMNRVRVATLVVSLGNVDTLICHPASMTHSNVFARSTPQNGPRRWPGAPFGWDRGLRRPDRDLDQAMCEI